jgi:hypothetical protein
VRPQEIDRRAENRRLSRAGAQLRRIQTGQRQKPVRAPVVTQNPPKGAKAQRFRVVRIAILGSWAHG